MPPHYFDIFFAAFISITISSFRLPPFSPRRQISSPPLRHAFSSAADSFVTIFSSFAGRRYFLSSGRYFHFRHFITPLSDFISPYYFDDIFRQISQTTS